MKKLFLIVTVMVISFAFLHADVYIKQKTNTGAFMGQPAKEIIQEHWLGNKKMAMVSEDTSFILNLETQKIVIANHKTKTYLETDLPLDMTKLMPDQMASMMKSMMEGMTVNVQTNGQTKKVQDWNCTGYDVKMTMMGMEMKMVFWATKDVPFDWKKYSDTYSELYSAQFRMGEKFMEEFKKIQGYPVQTVVSMMGMEITTNTEEINPQKQPGANVYSVPAGYTKKDKMSMEDMQQR